jgi:thymidine kinase
MAYMNTSNANTLHPHMQGQIQVILGPMFSGKTTELIRRMKRFAVAEQQCLIIKYGKDTRYSIDGVSTHDR